MAKPAPDITRLLQEYERGDAQALERLLPQVYSQLRDLAQAYLRRERPGHTLQPTALVHEAFLRLVEGAEVNWQNRAHFFAVCAQVMRRLLTDHAKAKKAEKRGGGAIKVSFDEQIHHAKPDEGTDLLALDEALVKLEKIDPRQARVVELRYFGGLSIEETASVLNSSPATIKRDWTQAKLWLYHELKKETET